MLTTTPSTAPEARFLRWTRHRILEQKDHPLRFLLGPKEDARGRLYTETSGDPRLDGHCFTYMTRADHRIRARVPVPDHHIPSKHSDDQRKSVVQGDTAWPELAVALRGSCWRTLT
jgi:hypothetical protein